MNSVKVIVATHKKFDDSILPEGYEVVKVGMGLSDADAIKAGYRTDNTGNNIASQNPWYCELTAHYWAWKNLECDICGLVHYRRFFMDYSYKSKRIQDDIMKQERIKEILSKYKVIVPYWGIKANDTMVLHKSMPREKDNRDWIIFQDIITQDYPEILPSFNRIVYGVKAWGLNMMITTKDIFDEYSEFLFDVLGKWDKELERRGIKHRPRVDGFYSETLMPIWIMSKFNEKQIYRADVMNTEGGDTKLYYSTSIKYFIKRFLKSIHWLNTIIHKMSLARKNISVDELPHSPID